ncbi:hypothetical protein OQA88_7531 [Cercophora sp. LCS_1]
MHFGLVVTALAGLTALAGAAPAEKGGAKRYQRRSRGLLSSVLAHQNQTNVGTIQVGTITVGQTLGSIGQLAQIAQLQQLAEAQLLAQIQSQVLLATQLQTIKDNIRINTLKARFSQVNTVLVTVTNVVDARDPLNINNRYLLNHQLIDNGFPNQEQVVMITEAQPMTIHATSEASSPTTTDASFFDINSLLSSAAAAEKTTSSFSSFNLASLLSSVAAAAQSTALSAASSAEASSSSTASTESSSEPTSSSPAPPSSSLIVPLTGGAQILRQQRTITTTITPLTASSLTSGSIPLSLLNLSNPQSFLLPYDTLAPTNPLILEDPANIIFPGNHHLLVESLSTLQADCAAFALGNGVFVGGGAGVNIFPSVQQAVAAQLTTIQIGTRVQGIPAAILSAHPDLAQGVIGSNKNKTE